jgi:DNA-binding transcriptional LysR family regulator
VITLRQLRYLVEVADEGHITRAAHRLHVAQPSLSKAITQLEAQLGVELLYRHARGVRLTPAGELFLPKARAAIAAVEEAEETARSVLRATRHVVDWGFISGPPMLEAPELYAAFTAAHSNVAMVFRELTYPIGSTATWLDPVDVALCYSPAPHPDVEFVEIQSTPRIILAAESHPLAGRRELNVADVVDEVFCGGDPSLEPLHAGLWRLDDHRGGRGHRTDDRVSTPQELIAVIATGRAIIAAPRSTATRVAAGIPGITAIPLVDADPVVLTLVWRRDRQNAAVDALASMARRLGEGARRRKPGSPAPARVHAGRRSTRERPIDLGRHA